MVGENNKLLQVTTKSIEKEYGHVIKWLGEAVSVKREVISTGCLGLDAAVGNGGLERGLIVELFGKHSAGKSFLGYSILREACRAGHKVGIVDAENSLDPSLLVQVGLPLDQVILVDGAPTGEANLAITDSLMQTGNFAAILVDSVAALQPEARVESDYNQQTIGLHARMMSAGLQKIMPVARKTNTLLIFVNQVRNKIGGYGNPETTTGGEALGFYTGYRIEVLGSPQTKKHRIVDPVSGELIGHRSTFRVVKNKRKAPYREAEIDLIYGWGYDTIGELLDLGVDVGLIDRSGAWHYYKDFKWQGKEKAKQAIRDNSELQKEVSTSIRKIINGDLSPLEEVITQEENKDDKPAGKASKGEPK